MTPTEHAQIYRELANYLTVPDIESGTIPARSSFLATLARQAAKEVEAQRAPTDEEIIEFWNCHCAGDGDPGIIKLARFGGGEIE